MVEKPEQPKPEKPKPENEGKVRHIEIQLPMVLLRTTRGLNLLDKLGRLRASKPLGWLFLGIFPIACGLGFYLVLNTVVVFITQPGVHEVVRSAGPFINILIPGLNPALPIVYGWIAIVVALIVHEGGHGFVARSLKFPVKAAGILLFTVIPIGAFVELDEEFLKKSSFRNAARVLAAGSGSNIVAAVVALGVIFLIVTSLTPITPSHGVGVVGVYEDYPAYNIGLMPGDIITNINGQPTQYVYELSEIMDGLNPGDIAALTVARGGSTEIKTVQLAANPENASLPFLGVSLIDDPIFKLDKYKEASSFSPLVYLLAPTIFTGPYVIPYSHIMHIFYTSPIGDIYFPLANMFFWIWFVNFNLAIFNALPIYPLDGGTTAFRVIKRLGQGKFTERTAKRITYAITAFIIFLILVMLLYPYIAVLP